MNVARVSSSKVTVPVRTDLASTLVQAKEQLERTLGQVQRGEGIPARARQLQADIQRVQGEIRAQKARLSQAENDQSAQTAQATQDTRDAQVQEQKQQAEAARTADKNNPSNSSDNSLNLLA